MSLKRAVLNVSGSLRGLRSNLASVGTGMGAVQRGATSAQRPLAALRTDATRAGTALGKIRSAASSTNPALGTLRTNADRAQTALGKLRTGADRGENSVRKLGTGLRSADGSLGKARGGTDRLKSSLDRLRGSADRTKNALRDVKRQSDAVEKSVGRAGKNADRGGRSMGQLGRGLKGASAAQKGLNLAMRANPLGLVMTLLTPLIAQFVNMDKVAKVVRRGLTAAWNGIRSASSSASRFLKPLFKGVVNAFSSPVVALVKGLNILIGAMNRIKFKVPGWVPGLGGKGFGFDLPRIPVPHLAEGGVVRARSGGTLALVAERGEHEAVIPLSKLERMFAAKPAGGAALQRLAAAVERLAERPVHVDVDSQTIARAVSYGQRQLARR
ncbi:hypothetical protein [Streptomyces silvensis]|uniref:hypothetical protein n=1 Tax=Streptomyces silvensis TaxID=1765722 RepID=UPI00099E548E|nr:hypothetical protein [Streptomyces silvensis]